MNVVKKAYEVARNYHAGEVRKAEKEKPFILHPISVATKLYESGFSNDDNILAAALLHDVVESTDCTREYIYKEFGPDIASLVNSVSESDPNLPWETRKRETIYRMKTLDLRHKVLKGADGWDNTEDLVIKFGIAGKKDFSSFKRGEAKKIWYWDNLYQSLTYNNGDNQVFSSFKYNIDTISGRVNFETLDELGKLHYKKLELYKLKNISDAISKFNELKKSKTTYVVGVSGSSNYLLEELANYLRISGLLVKTIDSNSNFYLEDKNLNTILTELANSSNSYYDIILVDCNVNLPLLYKMFLEKKFPKEVYYRYLNYSINELSKQLDCIVSLTYDENINLNNNNNFNYINEKSAINLYNGISYEYMTHSKDYTNISSFIITNNSSLSHILNDISNEIVENIRKKYLSDIKIKLKK